MGRRGAAGGRSRAAAVEVETGSFPLILPPDLRKG